jgi:hypothetical protein
MIDSMLMSPESNSYSGIRARNFDSGTGMPRQLIWNTMGSKKQPAARRSKKDRPTTMIRKVVADNVVALRDQVYAQLEHETQRNHALARDSGVSKTQVYRIIKADKVGCSIDYIEWLARPLGVQPADLLTPYFGQQRSVTVIERASVRRTGTQ